MIFFIVLKKDRKTGSYDKITTPDFGKNPELKEPNYMLVAWNEVYPLADPPDDILKNLWEAILTVGKADPICVSIINQSKAQFGINPFLDKAVKDGLTIEETKAIIMETLSDWANPMIGNIGNSLRTRPSTLFNQYISNWASCTFLDEKTKGKKGTKKLSDAGAIGELFQKMPPLKKASRDQVRICNNIVDLARAFFGEVTTYVSRQLEEIFALKLCRSKKLHNLQSTLIKTILDRHYDVIKELVEKNPPKKFSSYEYTYYYLLPANVSSLNGKQIWNLMEILIQGATIGAETEDKKSLKVNPRTLVLKENDSDEFKKVVYDCKQIWIKLPAPIRCAMLINDFRKIWIKGVPAVVKPNLKTANPPKKSMSFSKTPGQPDFTTGYKIANSATNSHMPGFKKWRAASWNRDERHLVTITYRHFLCPLWAGPSGHTGGGIQFWLQALGKDAIQETAWTITTSLFIFWRLYYDKRVTGFHTLVETFEASCNPNVIGKNVKKSFPLKEIKSEEFKDLIDNVDLIKLCSSDPIKVNNIIVPQSCCDPIQLFQIIKRKHFDGNGKTTFKEKLNELNRLIVQEKDNLTVRGGYHVIQWTDAISQVKGTNVQRFDLALSNLAFEVPVEDRYLPLVLKYLQK